MCANISSCPTLLQYLWRGRHCDHFGYLGRENWFDKSCSCWYLKALCCRFAVLCMYSVELLQRREHMWAPKSLRACRQRTAGAYSMQLAEDYLLRCTVCVNFTKDDFITCAMNTRQLSRCMTPWARKCMVCEIGGLRGSKCTVFVQLYVRIEASSSGWDPTATVQKLILQTHTFNAKNNAFLWHISLTFHETIRPDLRVHAIQSSHAIFRWFWENQIIRTECLYPLRTLCYSLTGVHCTENPMRDNSKQNIVAPMTFEMVLLSWPALEVLHVKIWKLCEHLISSSHALA